MRHPCSCQRRSEGRGAPGRQRPARAAPRRHRPCGGVAGRERRAGRQLTPAPASPVAPTRRWSRPSRDRPRDQHSQASGDTLPGATCAASATDRATVSDAVVSSADAGENEVLLVRVEVARRARQPCSHAGRPIDEGDIADGCITCPYHGSTFRSAAARSRGPGCVTAAAIRRARARRSGRGTRPPLTPSSSIILNG